MDVSSLQQTTAVPSEAMSSSLTASATATATMTVGPLPNNRLSYRCVHCTTPCDVLYRQLLRSSHSIKLTTCANCGQTVDPYIEREVLLIVLDCILLRIQAYRHVLYNRILLHDDGGVDENAGIHKEQHKSNSSASSLLEQFSSKRVIQFLLAWCLLDAYLTWETLIDQNSNHTTTNLAATTASGETTSLSSSSSFAMVWIALTSLVGIVLQWMAVYWYLLSWQRLRPRPLPLPLLHEVHSSSSLSSIPTTTTNSHTTTSPEEFLLSVQVYLALVLPSSFSVVTVLVIIWENTRMVRLLGSVLIAGWQCLALSVVSTTTAMPFSSSSSSLPPTSPQGQACQNNHHYDLHRPTPGLIMSPFLVALLVRVLWRLLSLYGTAIVFSSLSSSSLVPQSPCIGLEVIIPVGKIYSSVFYSTIVDPEGLLAWPVCLT
jgi:hypothetical protein